MSVFFYFLGALALASELPNLDIPKDWKACSIAADCMVPGDGCRSCGNPFVINKKFKNDFLRLDSRARAKSNFIRACEACSTAQLQLICTSGMCALKK